RGGVSGGRCGIGLAGRAKRTRALRDMIQGRRRKADWCHGMSVGKFVEWWPLLAGAGRCCPQRVKNWLTGREDFDQTVNNRWVARSGPHVTRMQPKPNIP